MACRAARAHVACSARGSILLHAASRRLARGEALLELAERGQLRHRSQTRLAGSAGCRQRARLASGVSAVTLRQPRQLSPQAFAATRLGRRRRPAAPGRTAGAVQLVAGQVGQVQLGHRVGRHGLAQAAQAGQPGSSVDRSRSSCDRQVGVVAHVQVAGRPAGRGRPPRRRTGRSGRRGTPWRSRRRTRRAGSAPARAGAGCRWWPSLDAAITRAPTALRWASAWSILTRSSRWLLIDAQRAGQLVERRVDGRRCCLFSDDREPVERLDRVDDVVLVGRRAGS